MVTVAKALGNGYPIGAVLMREEVGQVMGFGACVRPRVMRPILNNIRQGRMGRRLGVPRWHARLATTFSNG
jgi:glutamate-1-semialdehyde aminotransferase